MHSPVKVWRNQKRIASSIGKIGTILSWTIIRVPPGDFTDQAPYPMVLLQLADNTTMVCQLVDYEKHHLTAGQKVITVVRRVMNPDTDGVIPYGIKAKPLV